MPKNHDPCYTPSLRRISFRPLRAWSATMKNGAHIWTSRPSAVPSSTGQSYVEWTPAHPPVLQSSRSRGEGPRGRTARGKGEEGTRAARERGREGREDERGEGRGDGRGEGTGGESGSRVDAGRGGEARGGRDAWNARRQTSASEPTRASLRACSGPLSEYRLRGRLVGPPSASVLDLGPRPETRPESPRGLRLRRTQGLRGRPGPRYRRHRRNVDPDARRPDPAHSRPTPHAPRPAPLPRASSRAGRHRRPGPVAADLLAGVPEGRGSTPDVRPDTRSADPSRWTTDGT